MGQGLKALGKGRLGQAGGQVVLLKQALVTRGGFRGTFQKLGKGLMLGLCQVTLKKFLD
jgi:hypothetical protein